MASNAAGELRLNTISVLERPYDARQSLRFVFDDYTHAPLEIVLSQSSQGVVSLTMAIRGLPALWFEKRPGQSFVRTEGLLAPHSDAHLEQVLKYGIHTGMLEDFFGLAIDRSLLSALVRFKAFADQLETDALSGAMESATSDTGLKTSVDVCDEIAGMPELSALMSERGLGQRGEGEIQSWSCLGSLLNFSSGVLARANGRLDCNLCVSSRGGNKPACSECAAATGAAVAALIGAILDCFDGDEGEPQPSPPPPPPKGGSGGGGHPPLPQPVPIEGGGSLVPMYVIQNDYACVDGVCESQTIVTIIGWETIWP